MSQISGSRPNPIRSGMLRPSALQQVNSSTSNDSKATVLRPSVFNLENNTDKDAPSTSTATSDAQENVPTSSTAPPQNPFLLSNDNEDENNTESSAAGNSTGAESKDKDKSDPMTLVTRNEIQKSNLFATTKTSIPMNENGGFVFGQNVHERVTGDCLQNVELSKTENNTTNDDANGSSKLFAIAPAGTTNNAEPAKPTVEASVENLNEVARVYEESRARKRKYDEVKTFTGEEDEKNVLDVNGKLFAFVACNYEERGPGSLRVNDSEMCSRVVFRTSGNLRVLINTKVWPGMVVERPSQKSLRLTAIDSEGHVKIFLVMARPDDISNLYDALNKRIAKIKLQEQVNIESTENEEKMDENEDKIEEETNENENDAEENQVTEIKDGNSNEPSPKRPALDKVDDEKEEDTANKSNDS